MDDDGSSSGFQKLIGIFSNRGERGRSFEFQSHLKALRHHNKSFLTKLTHTLGKLRRMHLFLSLRED